MGNLKYDLETHYKFGDNWAQYANQISEQQLAEAQEGLLHLLDREQIEGKTFIDIGCGSGVHTLSALRLGAKSVHAIDFDPDSVETTQRVLAEYWEGDNYTIGEGNVLDPASMPGGPFDIVYSWGVLHHTGSMWEAISNAAALVAPGGMLVTAIYVKTKFCKFWKWEKHIFSRSPKSIQIPINLLYTSLFFGRMLTKGVSPIRYMRDYDKGNRGMNWWHNHMDWLGGYPYESASPEEITRFLQEKHFSLLKAFHPGSASGLFGSGCAEYVFNRDA